MGLSVGFRTKQKVDRRYCVGRRRREGSEGKRMAFASWRAAKLVPLATHRFRASIRSPRSVVSKAVRRVAMASGKPIEVGQKLPDGKLSYFDSEGNMQEVSVRDLTQGKKVVIFAVPGAFTPTCSLKHLPGFIEKADELAAKGVDKVCCVAVNDPFVMDAWGKSIGVENKVTMLADGSAIWTKALGVDLDLTDKGLGIRSRRYAMLVDDGIVKLLNLEEGGAFTVSSADQILSAL